MSRRIPRKVQIAGCDFKVVFREMKDRFGEYNHDLREIRLHKRYRNSTSQIAWDTLLHEMLHASLAMGGVSYALGDANEEAVVRNIEQLFLPALRSVTHDETP
jgi:hypothetical protein